LDVVPKDLSVTLRATLAEAFATFSTCREDALVYLKVKKGIIKA